MSVNDHIQRGIAKRSEGAVCVFVPGQPAPMIIQKQDGAFLYATTDLGTIRYRIEHWKPDAILYVVDHRQSMHFEQLFAVARMLWGDSVDFRHISFGTVLGSDGRPFQTRAGDTVGSWKRLLDKAIRASGSGNQANGKPTKPEGLASWLKPMRAAVAEIVGISALPNITPDLSAEPHQRLRVQLRKNAGHERQYGDIYSVFLRPRAEHFRDGKHRYRRIACLGSYHNVLNVPAERDMAMDLLRFAEALESSVVDFRPNQLTAYLYSLANRFATFFEQCPVLKAETTDLRDSRLLLCDLTARTIRTGLSLLGIKVAEKM